MTVDGSTSTHLQPLSPVATGASEAIEGSWQRGIQLLCAAWRRGLRKEARCRKLGGWLMVVSVGWLTWSTWVTGEIMMTFAGK